MSTSYSQNSGSPSGPNDGQRDAVSDTSRGAQADTSREPLNDTSRAQVPDAPDAPDDADVKTTRSRANRAVAIYGLLRIVLFVVLTAIIQLAAVLIDAPVPLVMSALLALIVAFPLSMLIFRRQRVEATEAVAEWSHKRRAKKEWVARELSER